MRPGLTPSPHLKSSERSLSVNPVAFSPLFPILIRGNFRGKKDLCRINDVLQRKGRQGSVLGVFFGEALDDCFVTCQTRSYLTFKLSWSPGRWSELFTGQLGKTSTMKNITRPSSRKSAFFNDFNTCTANECLKPIGWNQQFMLYSFFASINDVCHVWLLMFSRVG